MYDAYRNFLAINFPKYFLLTGLFFNTSCISSYAQVIPDGSMGNETSIVTENVGINGLPIDIITGGSARGINLFHSFQEFSVSEGKSAYFGSSQGVQNIFSRVTGANPSYIMGRLGVIGDANLYFLNPNGIIFGSHASLDLKSSFIATTADSILFGSQGSFDVSPKPNNLPLLTVNPSALKFNRINIAPIINNSTEAAGSRPNLDPSLPIGQEVSSLFGLRVPDGKSLLLVGGDVTLDGGGINSLGGRNEIASIQDEGIIGLSVNGDDLRLNIHQGLNLGNVTLTNGAKVDSSGEGGGSIQITGKNIQLNGGSQIVSETFGDLNGEVLALNATDLLEIIDFTTGRNISTITTGAGKAGDLNITTGQLVLRNGAQVSTSSLGQGSGGNLIVNASDFIELDGINSDDFNSSLSSSADSKGSGGDLVVKTAGNLILRNGATLTSSNGGITLPDGTFVLAEGSAGNLTITADGSVQLLDSFIFDGTNGKGNAGNLDITASNVLIDKSFVAASTSGEKPGGNIRINARDWLRVENESLISAQASNSADGGNLQINTPILIALPPTGSNGSDIVANAISGTGGNILVNAQGIFGIEERKAFDNNRSNDIDASSQFGRSGQVQINTANDPNKALVELPVTVVDPNSLVAQSPCRRGSRSEFTRSGRGGLPPSIGQDFNSDATQVALVTPASTSLDKQQTKPLTKSAESTTSALGLESPVVPAQGWVFNAKGEVVLVADNAVVAGPQRLKANPAGCPLP
jgi:filamentous hemagglutinin family protein